MKNQKDPQRTSVSRSGMACTALRSAHHGLQDTPAGQDGAAVRERLGQVSSDMAVGSPTRPLAPVESNQLEELPFFSVISKISPDRKHNFPQQLFP